MSQPPKNRPPAQPGSSKSQQPRRPSDEYDSDYPPPKRKQPQQQEYYDDDEYYEPQPRKKTNAPPPQQRGRYSGPPPPQRGRYGAPPPRGARYYEQRPRYVETRRDSFPYIMGGLIGAMVIGLGLVIFLIINNNNNNPTVISPPGTSNTPGVSATPPRMALAELKALYDNPATRPVIIDVRAGQAFNEGHIAGAINIPEAEVDILLDKVPRDKLVVAYCQWPAENESARVAQKLHDQYQYSYDNLKVLQGGWSAWQGAGYPIETSGTTAPGDGSAPSEPITKNIVITP